MLQVENGQNDEKWLTKLFVLLCCSGAAVYGHEHKETILEALRRRGYDVRLIQSKSVYK